MTRRTASDFAETTMENRWKTEGKKRREILKAEVDDEFLERIKARAKEEGETVSTLVRRAVRRYILQSEQSESMRDAFAK